ncbi:unnamed protein product [Rhizoctonia solani]|uniref:Uncharacterized protein n=1 Tax=Rhizoctonia solani TaxID=456999 RepID=A0A8H3GEB9_9AGAM|nr:unnamed protein product [Rhizoctonia solani]
MDINQAHIPRENDGRHDFHGEAHLNLPDSRKERGSLFTHRKYPPTKLKNRLIWFRLLWPILLHAVLAIAILFFLLEYVNHRAFNISERRPTVQLHDGTVIAWDFSALLQSDITTLLSVSIAVLRLIAAGWLSSMCWRCAFILMEEHGLKPEQLRLLISYSILTAPLRGQTKRQKIIGWLIMLVLVVTIPVQLAAPVINGSVTWIPAHHPPHHIPNGTISVPYYNGDLEQWRLWSDFLIYRQKAAQSAASLYLLTWKSETQKSGQRRYLPGLQLQINSTLASIVLPYFSAWSIEWVETPGSLMGEEKLNVENFICSMINVTGDLCRQPRYGPVLIPNVPWSNQTQPNSLVVSERQLVVEYVGSRLIPYSDSPNGCLYVKEKSNIGPDHAIYVDSAELCYQFAWVNYTAGTSICYDCPVLSHRTVHNNFAQSVDPDPLTETALRLAAEVIGPVEMMMYVEKESVWNSPEERIVGLLTRSYAASWVALTQSLWNRQLNTTYSISAPASQASVNTRRVYMWLGLQSLVTLSAVLFVLIQSYSDTPVIIDTALAAFYLDTSAISKSDGCHEALVERRVEFEGDRLTLKTQ